MKKKTIIVFIVILLLVLASIGGYFAYQHLYLPFQKYNHAVELYKSEDFSGALTEFSQIADYKDSKDYIYSMYKKYAGDEFVSESSHALVYLSSYLKDTTTEIMRTLLSGQSYQFDDDFTSDPTYKKYKNAYARVNELGNEFTKLFTDEIIDACNDEKLKSIREKYLQLLHDNHAMYAQSTLNLIQNSINNASSVEADFEVMKSKIEAYIIAYRETFE